MKLKNKKTAIIFTLMLYLLANIIFIPCLSVSSASKTYIYQTENKQLDVYTDISAVLGDMDLTIKPSKDNHFYLSYYLCCYNDKNPFTFQVKNGTLEMDSAKLKPASYASIKSINGKNKQKATLFIPAKQLDSITLDAKDADISLKGISSKNISVNTTDGDITLSKINVLEMVKLSSHDGDIKAFGLNIFGKSEISTKDGDITASSLNILGETNISTNDGDVSLKLKKKCIKQLNITLQTSNGDMYVANALKGKKKRCKSRWHYSKKGTSSMLYVLTKDGDISLK